MKSVLFDGLNDFENNISNRELELKKRAFSFDWKVAANEYLDVYNKILYY
jgi:glycosyltransferase involved in cell wall biosynthesis